MKPKDIFSLAIRLLGLFLVYLAIQHVAMIVSLPRLDVIVASILDAAFYSAVAWWFLGGAPLLMEQAYPSKSSQQTGEETGAKANG